MSPVEDALLAFAETLRALVADQRKRNADAAAERAILLARLDAAGVPNLPSAEQERIRAEVMREWLPAGR